MRLYSGSNGALCLASIYVPSGNVFFMKIQLWVESSRNPKILPANLEPFQLQDIPVYIGRESSHDDEQ